MLFRSLFFVWEASTFGGIVQTASGEHRMQDVTNNYDGPWENVGAHYDASSSRWYIPLSKFYHGDGSLEHSGRRHLLRLDLHLSDGSQHWLNIQFRLEGPTPLPLVQHVMVDPSLPIPVLNWATMFTTPGLPVGKTIVRNPSDRPLEIWIRTHEADSMRISTIVGYHRYVENQYHTAEPDLVTDRWRTSASLNLGAVTSHLSGGTTRTDPMSTQKIGRAHD